eukprot:TRINITY_DN19868_c0_g1_i1.p1 TRINITY_DN19868_c0_g1~~TRINITY_DN19868_c0_g1_i1.p1  ORF type:complete len:398 (-),score=96.84 TRINITY_DN19868_c0_g1_i1:185-1378(-)
MQLSCLAVLLCIQPLVEGATLPDVPTLLTQGPDGSLAAAAAISKDEPAMSIPTDFLLWAPGAHTLPKIGEALRAAKLDQISCVALALCYIWSEPDAKLHAWSKTLPTQFGTPLHWSPEERLELQGGMAAEMTNDREAWISSTYMKLTEQLLGRTELFPPEHYTAEQFSRALSVVWERGLVVAMEDSKLLAVLPHLDSAKRTTQATTQLVLRGEAVHVLAALDPGMLLQVAGGSTMEMLLNRGEVLESGENTRVLLRGYPDPEQVFGVPKRRMLGQAGLSENYLYWVGMHSVDPLLLTALRIDAISPSELHLYPKAQAGAFISERNERSALRLLIQICGETLKMYGTKLDTDIGLLNQTSIGRGARLALVHRRNEKFVLERCTGLARQLWRQMLWDNL